MTRRLALLAGALTTAFALTGAGTANADLLDRTPDPTIDLDAAQRYWACVAIDHVEVGACLSNPLPDLSKYPTVPDMVDDLTDIRPPTVPRP